MRSILVLLSLFIATLSSCSNDDKSQKNITNDSNLSFESSPKWAQEAIWYQVFVERFRNGDASNDPTLEDIKISYPHKFPDNWQITPWNQQWYKLSSWEKDFYGNDFYTAVQSRRYGGDLKGLLDKMDYLADLGINALYINPLNYSASMHKFDAANYIHVDPTFGPDPQGDKEIIAKEDVLDPKTWKFTSADKLFLRIIEEAHKRGIKVVLDYSWNHTGVDHPMFQDILKNQDKSKYADYYVIDAFDDPKTPENEFAYTGWAGVKNMPELKKVDVENRVHGKPYKGNIHPVIKQHIFDVSKRWLDPMDNGDFSKGLDGYRLDVADQIGMDFWREYRKFVRSVNPECYLIGEIWWEKWPNKLMDPRPYTKGDIFDAVMHYQWYKPARKFFAAANGAMSPKEFVHQMDSIFSGYKVETERSMMNMSASHDTPRLSTSFFNKNPYKKIDRNSYDVTRPDAETWDRIKMFLIHQFSFIGSPQIWQGDEMGMWGGDDPDDRKPLIWDDIKFEAEDLNYKGEKVSKQEVKADRQLIAFYKKIIQIRKDNPELIYGDLNYNIVDNDNNVLAYSRKYKSEIIYTAFNLSNKKQSIKIEVNKDGVYEDLISGEKFTSINKILEVNLEGISALILKIAKD